MPRIRLVSTAELALLFDVSPKTIQRWVREGLIEPDARTPGGHMRWDPDRVEVEMHRVWRQRRDSW